MHHTVFLTQPIIAIVKGEVAKIAYKLASDIAEKQGVMKIKTISEDQLKDLQREIKASYLEYLMNCQELKKKYEAEIKKFIQSAQISSSDESVDIIIQKPEQKPEPKIKVISQDESMELLKLMPRVKKQKLIKPIQTQPVGTQTPQLPQQGHYVNTQNVQPDPNMNPQFVQQEQNMNMGNPHHQYGNQFMYQGRGMFNANRPPRRRRPQNRYPRFQNQYYYPPQYGGNPNFQPYMGNQMQNQMQNQMPQMQNEHGQHASQNNYSHQVSY